MAIGPESEENVKKGLTVIMAVMCLALAAVYVVISLAEDDEPPKIEIQDQELTYSEGDDWDVLLQGVTASDKRDGDVTDSLLVENVYPVPEAGVATVVYVARDDSNNIAKASRTVTYGTGDGTAAAADGAAADAAETTETASAPEPTATPEATPEPTPTEEPEEDLPEGSPRITLTTDEDTVEAGSSVNRIEYVESIEDDEDDENDLWRSIQIAGDELDTDTPGTYELIYYVIDSDGNQSNEARLTITVE